MNRLTKGCGMLLLALMVLPPGVVAGAKQSTNSDGLTGRTEILLSDADWKLGSFPIRRWNMGSDRMNELIRLKIPAKKGRILILKSLFRPENEAFETRTPSWPGRIGIIWLGKFGI